MQTSREIRRERIVPGWLISLTVAVVAIAGIAFLRRTQAEITGPISQTEQPVRPDGTVAHPYSDASQCPAHTDVVFWPSGLSVPSFPASISVCFVGKAPP